MFRSIAVGVICLAVLASGAFAQNRVSATEKGSLLVYPKVEVRWDSHGYLIQDTILTLNNDLGQDVNIEVELVNENCTHRDNSFKLTANQPVYWKASSGEPLGISPWSVLGDPIPDPEGSGDMILRGYVLLWAVNAGGVEIRWNHLYGGATIINYRWETAWEYNAYAFQAVNPNVANGDVTGTPGVLNLDGAEYAFGFQYLLLDFFASGSLAFSGDSKIVTNDTDLTLMILSNDLRQETTGPFTTKAVFAIWNENEIGFSGNEFCFTKFNEELLSHRCGGFLVSNLQTSKGRARVNGIQSNTVCGVDPNGLPLSGAFSLLGVQAKVLCFNLTEKATSGGDLVGSGTMAAKIQYDVPLPPPEVSGGRTRAKLPMSSAAATVAN